MFTITRIAQVGALAAAATTVAVVGAAVSTPADAAVGSGPAARATLLDAPVAPATDHPKRVVGLSYRPARHRLVVTFRDGSRYRFTPCPQEDSDDCYWLAGYRGNRHGRDFVTLNGHSHYFTL